LLKGRNEKTLDTVGEIHASNWVQDQALTLVIRAKL
jgi:hypothetical protein